LRCFTSLFKFSANAESKQCYTSRQGFKDSRCSAHEGNRRAFQALYANISPKREPLLAVTVVLYITQQREKAYDQRQRAQFLGVYGVAAKQTCPEVPENVHCHLWRHIREMHLYQHGMDLSLLSQWLGHAQLETSLIYPRADTEMKRHAIALATTMQNPLRDQQRNERFVMDDEETLKLLMGLR
jgi:hypothetical protein